MESKDLKTAIQDFAQECRDSYRCESPTWVMSPVGYDRYVQRIEAGTVSQEFAAWFRANVRRGEIMEP